MNWRFVCASEVGTSHVANGTPCQDRVRAWVETFAFQQPVLVVLVADGAGSAEKGGEGAEEAIEAAAAFIAGKKKRGRIELGDALAHEIVLAVRARIDALAEAQQRPVRDFACTFLGVLSAANATLVFQIGDGGVVVDTGDGLELAVVPMTGEYANMTRFVTDEDVQTALQVKTYPGRALKLAAFTDGLQRLGIDLVANTPHEPFFAPFFRVIAEASVEQEKQFHDALLKFLGSDRVNERTDDDKTLVLAHWIA